MIVYSRGPFGLTTLLGHCGSVLTHTAVVGAFSAAIAVTLQLVGAGPAISSWWRSAVLPYQLFAFILGFVVTFRPAAPLPRGFLGKLRRLVPRRSPCGHSCSDLSPALPVLEDPSAARKPAAAGEGRRVVAAAAAAAAAAVAVAAAAAAGGRGAPFAAQPGEHHQHQHQHQHQLQRVREQQQQHPLHPQQQQQQQQQQQKPHHNHDTSRALHAHDQQQRHGRPLHTQPLVALRPALRADAAYRAIYARLARRREEGGLAQPPPLLAGLFAKLEGVFACFHELLAVAALPFPFPWAQMDVYLLMLHTIATPVVVVAFLDQPVMCAAVAFITVQAYVATNEVARAIEEPFQLTPNGLPLLALQRQLNERLLVVADLTGVVAEDSS